MRRRQSEAPLITYEPDILTRGLDVLFCGLNPAATAAAAVRDGVRLRIL